MEWIDDLPDGVREIVATLRGLPDFPHRLAEFALALYTQHSGKGLLYEDLARRAWELAPRDDCVRVLTEWAIRQSVPSYHIPIVNDQSRMRAYDQALRELVTVETIVLEIGTGTGVLAMMAARAGAKHTYTCESERLVADVARENIVNNDLSECITVIDKRSTEVIVGEDMPLRANLLISDLITDDLLGMDVLPVTEDAKARLLTPEAKMVPAVIAMRGVLVGGEPWTDRFRLNEVCGLDLSSFNRFAPPTVSYPVDWAIEEALSNEVEIVRFDLDASHHSSEKKVIELTARRDGVADGFLHWLWLGLTDTVEVENKPAAPTFLRTPVLHVFLEPIVVQAGTTVFLNVEHDRESVQISPPAT